MTNLTTEIIGSESKHSLQTLGGDADDRRVFPRYPIANKLTVQLRVLPGPDVINALIHDLSRDGIGLTTAVFIAPGESITFPVGADWIVADVRHCRPSQEGYLVGGVITDIVYDSEPEPAN